MKPTNQMHSISYLQMHVHLFGMKASDAVALRIGAGQRELDLGNVPLVIRFIPKKGRKLIGDRITFLGSNGVEMLKQYIAW